MTILKIGSKTAFTLIEVLLAVTILAIGMTGVIRAYFTMINAMETAQYSIDAACLMKVKMGEIEENAIMTGGTKTGSNTGNFAGGGDMKAHIDHPDDWVWTENIVREAIAPSASENKPDYYLNAVTLTVVNASRIPARKVDAATYMRSVAVDGN